MGVAEHGVLNLSFIYPLLMSAFAITGIIERVGFSCSRLLVVAMCFVAVAGGQAAMSQQVSIRLYEDGDDRSTVLPEGTTVLILGEEGSRAQSLEDLGIEQSGLRRRLLARAVQSPEALLDTLGADGESQGRYTTGILRYVLAHTPNGTLYESQVDTGPGFDLVVSGLMYVRPVTDTRRSVLQQTFDETVRVATTTPLTLKAEDGERLPTHTEVVAWGRAGDSGQSVQERSFLTTTPDFTGRLASKGTTQNAVARTWHSNRILYVAARTPDGNLYESRYSSEVGFDFVYQGDMTMAPVPESARTSVQSVFASSSVFQPMWALFARAKWLLFGIGGILVGILVAGGWSRGKIGSLRQKRNRLKAELEKKRKAVDQAAGSYSRDSKAEEGEALSKMREKNDELRQEIAELKKKVHRRDENLQQLKEGKEPSSVAHSEDMSKDDGKSKDMLREEVNRWRSKAQVLASQRERDQRRIQELEAELDDAEADVPTTDAGEAESNVPGRGKEGEASVDEDEHEHPIGTHFVEWCRGDRIMKGRYYMFERALDEEGIDAHVTPIFYDLRTEDRFSLDRDVSGQEFWMVEGEADLLLLPVPKPDDTFRVLAPAYEGNEDPPEASAVKSIAPARLADTESGYCLRQKGKISTTSPSSS